MQRDPNESAADELDQAVADARLHRARVDAVEGQLHIPNHIPMRERIGNVLLSLLLMAYAVHSLTHDDIYIAGRRGPGVHLHGVPVWMMCAAMFCAVANMLSVVVDHYDRRANESRYRRFAILTQLLGWLMFFGAFAALLWLR